MKIGSNLFGNIEINKKTNTGGTVAISLSHVTYKNIMFTIKSSSETLVFPTDLLLTQTHVFKYSYVAGPSGYEEMLCVLMCVFSLNTDIRAGVIHYHSTFSTFSWNWKKEHKSKISFMEQVAG